MKKVWRFFLQMIFYPILLLFFFWDSISYSSSETPLYAYYSFWYYPTVRLFTFYPWFTVLEIGWVQLMYIQVNWCFFLPSPFCSLAYPWIFYFRYCIIQFKCFHLKFLSFFIINISGKYFLSSFTVNIFYYTSLSMFIIADLNYCLIPMSVLSQMAFSFQNNSHFPCVPYMESLWIVIWTL